VRVLYFGTYDRVYPRNAQVISCLRGAGVDVVEHHVSVWEGRQDNWEAGLASSSRVAVSELRLLRRPKGFDALIVGYPGHFDFPAARWAARGRPVVFNPLVSLADTLVDDRARFRSGSQAARALGALDRFAFRRADVVVADTDAHATLFRELGARRVETALVGAEERVFTPGWTAPERFGALFVGKLIPLHGLETILEAARLAPELTFRIVGNGQLDALLDARPPNVDWVRWVDYEELPRELHAAGCALGIFGTSAKAARVIPNKAYQALACGAPLVTADTPAARELLTDGADALLVPPGDARALAAALRHLAGDRALAQTLSANGLRTYHERASEAVLGARWREIVERARA